MTPITEPRGHSVKRLKSSTIKTILYSRSLVQIWTESRNLDLMAIGKHCKMHNKYIWHKDSQKDHRREAVIDKSFALLRKLLIFSLLS